MMAPAFAPWTTIEEPPPNLDDACSRQFTWRALIACGPSFAALAALDIRDFWPAQIETWRALAGLAQTILDPLVECCGRVELSYAFSPLELTAAIRARFKRMGTTPQIAPELDQHAAHELNRRGLPICERGGAAADLRVSGRTSLAVVEWLHSEKLPVDSVYFYGSRWPLHVSWHREPRRRYWRMVKGPSGRLLPRSMFGENTNGRGTK